MTNPVPVAVIDSSNRPRVLVIDDDPQVRNLVVAFLRRDYLVAVAGDGEEGYQKALEHHPDIAVIDIQMEGWDGLRTLKAFRENPSLSDVKTVMLTADSSRQTVMAAISIGADDYIVKTALSRDDLLQKLARLRQLPNRATRLYSVAAGPSAPTDAVSESVTTPPKSTNSAPNAPVSTAPQSVPDQVNKELQVILDAWE